MAEVTLRSESVGIRPQFEHVEESIRRADTDSPIIGAYQRREIEAVRRRRYGLRWPNTNEGERFWLLKSWDDSFQGVLEMDYTPVDDVDANLVEVVFVGPPSITNLGGDRYSMTATVEEAP